MEKIILNIKQRIQLEIQNIEQIENDSITKIEQIVNHIEKSINQLRNYICQYEFANQEEEILFFKVQKPSVFSLLLYNVRIYHIERDRLGKTDLEQSIFLKKEIILLESNITNSFYNYYYSGDTSLDKKYFTREAYTILVNPNCNAVEKDRSFSTACDHDVSDIIASELLKRYLVAELKKMNCQLLHQAIDIIQNLNMQWTASKVSLVELIYAIYSCNCINNGNVSLKEIAISMEMLFHINVGNFYRVFLEIRERKKNRTSFLDQMREQLIASMDNLDKY